MFTGLVAAQGVLVAVEGGGEGAQLEIDAPPVAEVEPGDSVAVSGACLTAREVDGSRLRADVVAETLRRTTLGELGDAAPGRRVNVEVDILAKHVERLVAR